MNVFEQTEQPNVITFQDTMDDRVLLDCQNCGKIVFEGKYIPSIKMLTWKCPDCEHISKQENFEIE